VLPQISRPEMNLVAIASRLMILIIPGLLDVEG
jgi:hypothetical protein